MKKQLIALLLVLTVLLGITGCAGNPGSGKDKIQITMHLWDKSMCKVFTPWLEQKFPEIDFTFVVGYNTMDYYTDLNQRGALPDIITCRRFSLNDATHMSDLLMDLSQTNVVGTFYDAYIENNREPGGAIRWLPMCAEVDGYIANLDLFDRYHIPVPTNYAEFAEAIRLFEENGIHGYINDYARDYSCMEALQGCAIPELMSLEGIMWRAKYESEASGEQVGLDDKVWPKAFQKLEQYLKDTYVKPEDYNVDSSIAKPAFLEGRLAILRGTGSDCTVLNETEHMNCAMLPYFGETAEDNWLLTYPTFQVAVSNGVQKDKAKTEAVMKVLDAMFSEEGQRAASVNNAVLSYNRDVDMDLGTAYSKVRDCVSSNRLYMRLASTEMFAVSLDVVQKMIRGEYDAAGAYADFNAQITAVPDNSHPEIITTQNTAYAYEIGEHGSPAASAVVNTLRREFGSDVAIGYSNLITAPVFQGDYTAQQLSWLVANRVLHREGTLTGAELKALMEWLVNVKDDGSNPIRHSNLLPVTSGMEYTITAGENGTYTLESLTINGQPLDDNAEYSVIMLGDNNFILADYFCNCPMPQDLNEKMVTSQEKAGVRLAAALSGGKQFEAPTEYLTIRR